MSTVAVEIYGGALDGTTLNVDTRNAEKGTAVIKEGEQYYGLPMFMHHHGHLCCDGRAPVVIPTEQIVIVTDDE